MNSNSEGPSSDGFCKDVNKRQILQIIDVSHKLLYDDIKAEYKFHSLINATVSHELRNPLNSMIC